MKLPYRAQAATGNVYEIEFPLHDQTHSAVRVEQLVSSLLRVIDNDIAVAGETSNGDLLQAIAIAMAIRAGIINASHDTSARLAHQLLHQALDAVAASRLYRPQSGHA